jgi:hypothetical protein
MILTFESISALTATALFDGDVPDVIQGRPYEGARVSVYHSSDRVYATLFFQTSFQP